MIVKVKNKFKIKTLVLSMLLFFSTLAIFSAAWYRSLYGDIGFDSILFTLLSELNGVDTDILVRYFLGAGVPAVATWAAVMFVFHFKPKKSFKFYPIPQKIARITAVVLSVSMLFTASLLVSIPQWLVMKMQKTTLYEDEFVDPNSVSVKFPEQKRNLIYILLESTETTYFSKNEGGGLEHNLMPNLYKEAKENISFSHLNGEVGGARTPTASTWTIAAMVSQTAGIPLKLPAGIEKNSYGNYTAFLPGATSITDILNQNGYYQALMVGSDADFGGRSNYYSQHGIDKIYDIYTAYDDGIVPKDYWVWWGMEDKYLFEYAKKELTEISNGDKPFAFTMLTVDTHFVDGYKCEFCEDTYSEPYENVIACADRQVSEFLEWIKTQPFYENTTVIVAGDHLTMDNGYIERTAGEDYERHTYNCFLNSPITPTSLYNRDFTTFDMFPTTLAAIGCEIEGERLGLGTNLFSTRKTLTEEYGFDYISDELAKQSDYYTNKLLNAYKK